MGMLASDVINEAMRLYGAVDSNLNTHLLSRLNRFIESLYANYHLDINRKTATITASDGATNIAMPADLAVVKEVEIQTPRFIGPLTELDEGEWLRYKALFTTISRSTPSSYFPDYTARTIEFPFPLAGGHTFMVDYSTRFTPITLGTDMGFFSNNNLLVMALYMEVSAYNHRNPSPVYAAMFQKEFSNYLNTYTRMPGRMKYDESFKVPILAIP